MKTLTAQDIAKIYNTLSENFSVFAGKGDNRRVLIKPGLKITNKETGINYTVVDVQTDGDDIFINCYRADVDKPGVYLRLGLDDLKEFERL